MTTDLFTVKQLRQTRRALNRAADQLKAYAVRLPTVPLRRQLYDIEQDLRFAHQATEPSKVKP